MSIAVRLQCRTFALRDGTYSTKKTDVNDALKLLEETCQSQGMSLNFDFSAVSQQFESAAKPPEPKFHRDLDDRHSDKSFHYSSDAESDFSVIAQDDDDDTVNMSGYIDARIEEYLKSKNDPQETENFDDYIFEDGGQTVMPVTPPTAAS